MSNSQFPEELLKLNPVTQLYLSLDGSTPEGLRKLDRPLFKDYWDRFMKSLENLSKRVCDDSVVIDIGNRKKELSFVSRLSKAIIWKYIHGRKDRIE